MSETPTAQTNIEIAKQRLKELQESRDPQKQPVTIAPKTIHPVGKKPVEKKFSQELKEAIFGEEIINGPGGFWKRMFFDKFIPGVKRIFGDMANSAINAAFGLDPKTRTVGSSHVANASIYRDRNYSRSDGSGGYSARTREAVSDFIWDEETAADIYNQCIDILDRYPSLSLSEVYSIMDMPTKIRSTDNKWGWTNPRSIDLVCVDFNERLYRIEFPPARPI